MQIKDRIEIARESLIHAHTTLLGQPETKIRVDQLDLGNTLRFMEQKLERYSRAVQGHIDAIITASSYEVVDKPCGCSGDLAPGVHHMSCKEVKQ